MRFSPDTEKDFEKVIYEEEQHHWRTTKVYQPDQKRNRYDDDYDVRDDWDDYNDR